MNLEIYPLRVFSRVMELKSFSGAAAALRISQPTVSQQIARLESSMKAKLFQRVGHKIVPTEEASKLWSFARSLLAQISEFEEDFATARESPRGTVRYGMPESCQWTPHYRRIMAQIQQFPLLHFKIAILPSDQVEVQLLRGDLDFGFIAGERNSADLRYEKFCEEPYCLVGARDEMFKGVGKRGPAEARWIQFPGSDVFFRPWAKANRWKGQSSSEFSVVQIGTLAGAVHAVQEGAGISVLPRQCVAKDLEAGTLAEWQGGRGASNPIYLARRIGEQLPLRVELVMELLWKAKQELG